MKTGGCLAPGFWLLPRRHRFQRSHCNSQCCQVSLDLVEVSAGGGFFYLFGALAQIC